ncbi:MAG: ABC transporter ATP-binding protein [Anaerolineae bacterium]|nr:ABC transporter ATP-binding protein [Chloroflexi bacterium CFX1]MCQ3946552.1 ABC transporter ATP-binding protein [Anaerolineae bacterium]
MPVISVENLSKSYRLGQINTGTFSRDLEAWWARLRGRPNPHLRIGETDPLLTARSAKSAKEELNPGGLSGLRGSNSEEDDIVWALKDVSFTVEQGEVLGIIGRNGAGKSTLLKILSRVTAPTSGRIRVKGRVASLLEVGTGFHPELTGRENVYLNGAILGMTRQEVTRKFDEIVDFAGVEKFIDTPVKRYSSGMYVRLAFAVAAHLDPEILVVDEVLAVGDAEFQKKCLGKMGEVAQGGRTVLFVSHNMAAVSALCKNGVVLQDGKLAVFYPVNDAINYYIKHGANLALRVSPKERRDRQGNGAARISDVKVLNSTNEIISQVPLDNGALSFQIDVEGKETIRSAWVAIGVYDTLNRCILWLDSQALNFEPTIKEGNNHITCTISSDFTFTKGTYSLNIAIFQGKDMLDYLPSVTSFDVIDGDFYGTGKISGGNPAVYVKQEWKKW